MQNLDKLQYDGHVTIYPFPKENNDRYTRRRLRVSLPCIELPTYDVRMLNLDRALCEGKDLD